MRKLIVTALAVLLLSALVAAPSAVAVDFGFVSDSTIAKTHEPVAFICGFGFTGSPFDDCRINRQVVVDADHTSGAGEHPDATGGGFLEGVDATRSFHVLAPPGFVGVPTVATMCSRESFALTGVPDAPPEEQCPPTSQVGLVNLFTNAMSVQKTMPVYRLTPKPGFPASFGFKVLGESVPVTINANVRTDGDYGITLFSEEIPSRYKLFQATATLWGVPGARTNDEERWNPFLHYVDGFGNVVNGGNWGALPGSSPRPLLQTPADCSNEGLATRLRIRSWQQPDVWLPDALPEGDPRHADYVIPTPKPTGCEDLRFEPELRAVFGTENADSPAGASVRLRIPQVEVPEQPSTPPLRKAVVKMPAGMMLNPAAATGREGCTTDQIGLVTTAGEYPNPIRFAKYVDEAAQVAERCPDAAKIGTARVISPALEDPVPADVYLAQPHDNPFDSLFAIYLVVRGPGFTAKLAGHVEVDEQTGGITTTFDHSPQLPVGEVEFDLFGGSRAPLVTPRTCGDVATTSELTPWSHPDSGPPAASSSGVEVSSGPGGSACPAGLSGRPFGLGFEAGSVNPIAGDFSPFAVRLTRPDGHQEVDQVEVATPTGFAASLKGVPYCPETGVAQAIARDQSGDGAIERTSPSCPEASKVGTTTVGAGAGPNPVYVSGNVYLAGPYKGAPLSLVFVVPAMAGPFDLGVQVVRAAVHVDRKTAQVRTVSDAIPKMLLGVPLKIRDIRVSINRRDFTINPSSCAEKQIGGRVEASHGAATGLGQRFQVADCVSLPFKPKLALRLTGRRQIKTGKHPGIRAQVTQKGVGEAGIRKAEVRLPKSLALDVNNAGALCEFEDGTKPDLENHCPKGSIVGRARATTPLLDQPLVGNVYFVKNVRRDPKTGNVIRTLPMIIAALRGQIAINLTGTSNVKGGKLVSTFAQVPDAPVSRFNLNINGGNNGIIAVTRTRRALINLCANPTGHIAESDTDGHNGRRHDTDIRMKTPCSKRQIKNAKRAAKKAARKANRR